MLRRVDFKLVTSSGNNKSFHEDIFLGLFDSERWDRYLSETSVKHYQPMPHNIQELQMPHSSPRRYIFVSFMPRRWYEFVFPKRHYPYQSTPRMTL
jgi:hypothetical protein